MTRSSANGGRPPKRGLSSFITLLGVTATASAIWDQLRRPATERTWHGKVFGFVPYDLRIPTAQKLRKAFWDPTNGNVVKGKAFGVGWDVNLAAVWARLRG